MDRRANLLAGQYLIRAPRVVGVQRHELDEAHLIRGAPGELGERDRLLLGKAADRDRVDLDRMRLREAPQQLQPAEHLGQRVAAGQLVEAVALKRVDRDVEAVDPRPHQGLGIALEQEPVRGHGDFRDIFDVA